MKTRAVLFVILPGLLLISSFIWPIVQVIGLTRPVNQLHNTKCQRVPDLPAVEDAWIDYDADEAYLCGSSQESRQHWLPAILHLNASKLPEHSVDYVAVMDLNTLKHRRLEIVAPTEVTKDFNTHAIEGFHRASDRKHLTLFLNSHRPPAEGRDLAPKLGADSVIEVFETRTGSNQLKWLKTIRHPLIRTPNNIVATSETSFYVTNDHRHKVHWGRAFGIFYHVRSDIIHCDFASGETKCIVAAEGVYNPNGIAMGAQNKLWQASSGEPVLTVYEIQSGDHTLIPTDRIPVGRIMDNLHVADDGSVYVNTFPHPLHWVKAAATAGRNKHLAPTEAWRISNNTDESRHLGNKYKVELAFADDGSNVMWPTSAVPWKNKLISTGIFSETVVVCDLS
ncbi:hypothetical protein MVLG_05822 [Microbotryum lychnidis-dioicae p1A1 Lamole]|uniref:SMP-30/Gluconolactonase/LRE-like region domain-containing protein n=1 Tax=Microbotryum lychnidis-dioicae (strain p1A1 Lamole / MvSl-1064) TaxID=683840 RepID=U5HFE5_USTV1|nr:hypothetical protein MVLG_05822 [Microbotryum lychnidis-dioicae p1A1 Lamole]|eukprot:KDE03691.1 hypothetical protein MVLG_05822 [Microbotryum lychnidis-dioicae p1A1 Lamole]